MEPSFPLNLMTQQVDLWCAQLDVPSEVAANLYSSLSPDEKVVYVTNGGFGAPTGSIAAFDVQPDGSLKNQREFAKLPTGGGDGLAVDAKGNLYVTAGPNLHVIAPDGKLLGSIPAPYSLITAAFAGKDKKTIYAVVSLIDPMRLQHAYVYSIPMVAQGYKGRAK